MSSLAVSHLLAPLLVAQALPLLSKAVGIFRRGGASTRPPSSIPPLPPPPRTRADRLATLLLVLYVAALGAVAAMRPFNLLATIGSNADEQSFLVRQKYLAYVDGLVQTEGVHWREHAELERLYEALRSKENRRFYWAYGHQAFTQCKWCAHDLEYALFEMPMVLAASFVHLAVLGIATMPERRVRWRAIVAAQLVGVVSSVLSVLGLPMVQRLLIEYAPEWPLHDTLRQALLGAFALMAVAVLLFDRGPSALERQRADVLMCSRVVSGNANLLALLQRGVLLSPPLRASLDEAMARFGQQRQQLLGDPTIQAAAMAARSSVEVQAQLQALSPELDRGLLASSEGGGDD